MAAIKIKQYCILMKIAVQVLGSFGHLNTEVSKTYLWSVLCKWADNEGRVDVPVNQQSVEKVMFEKMMIVGTLLFTLACQDQYAGAASATTADSSQPASSSSLLGYGISCGSIDHTGRSGEYSIALVPESGKTVEVELVKNGSIVDDNFYDITALAPDEKSAFVIDGEQWPITIAVVGLGQEIVAPIKVVYLNRDSGLYIVLEDCDVL